MSKPCITLDELNKNFINYMKRDNEWKRKIENQMKPLVEERLERQILQRFGMLTWKIIVAVVTLVGGILLILYYFRKL